MLFAYETERLLLKIIKPDQADAVLDFYMRDKELFEKFEPDRMPNFYTRQFQRQMLLFAILYYSLYGRFLGTFLGQIFLKSTLISLIF